MKKKRRDTSINRCPRCRINMHWCFCEHIPSINNKIKVSVVMHFSERWLTSNTAYFAKEVLSDCDIFERGNLASELNSFKDEEFNKENTDYIYLYPTPDSRPIEEYVKGTNEVVLVVPDGSWSKAKKFHKREEILKNMNKFHLTNVGVSQYQLRKSPGENFLCTYEAIAKALGILDSKEVEEEMLDFFKIFVDRVLQSRRGEH